MNPVIAQVASASPFSPVDYVWFDFTDYHKHKELLNEHLGNQSLGTFIPDLLIENVPMPFDRMACVLSVKTPNSDELKMMVITVSRFIHADKPSELLFCTWGNSSEPNTTMRYESTIKSNFSVDVSQEFQRMADFRKYDYVRAHQDMASLVIWMIIVASKPFTFHQQPVSFHYAYKCTANPKNPSRAKRGKRPLFEWETVVIKPHEPRVSLGGTHASPKPHDRRGHQRRYKSGKVVYVRPHTINKHKIPTEGFIHHDYKVAL